MRPVLLILNTGRAVEPPSVEASTKPSFSAGRTFGMLMSLEGSDRVFRSSSLSLSFSIPFSLVFCPPADIVKTPSPWAVGGGNPLDTLLAMALPREEQIKKDDVLSTMIELKERLENIC